MLPGALLNTIRTLSCWRTSVPDGLLFPCIVSRLRRGLKLTLPCRIVSGPQTIYETFIDLTCHSILGGVSAELPDSPSLENYDSSPGGKTWRTSSAISILISMTGREVGIRRGVYLPVWRELDYGGILPVRSPGDRVPFCFSP